MSKNRDFRNQINTKKAVKSMASSKFCKIETMNVTITIRFI